MSKTCCENNQLKIKKKQYSNASTTIVCLKTKFSVIFVPITIINYFKVQLI